MQDLTHPRLISTSRYRRKNEGPGPGSYDPCLSLSGPRISFGCRLSNPKVGVGSAPPPGTYNIDFKPSTPGFTFGSRRAEAAPNADVPGPGAYNFSDRASTPSFLINSISRYRFTKQPIQPGPGAYEVHHFHPRGPRYSFTSKAHDSKDREKTPGPGAYKPKLIPCTIPNIHFTSSERPSTQSLGPGPGTYFDSSYASSVDSSIISPFRGKIRKKPSSRGGQSSETVPISPATSSRAASRYSARSSVGSTCLPILRYLTLDETDVPDLRTYNYTVKTTSPATATTTSTLSEYWNCDKGFGGVRSNLPSRASTTLSTMSPLFSGSESDGSCTRGQSRVSSHGGHEEEKTRS